MNEEILGGLRSAVERGESLNKAMMTFYNSGYKKEEIEEAARFLNQNPIQVSQTPSLSNSKPTQGFFGKLLSEKKPESKQIPQTNEISSPAIPQAVIPDVSKAPKSNSPSSPVISNYGESQQNSPVQPVVQQVSNYGNEGVKDRVAITLLIVVLVILVGLLASVFLFKQEITNFLSSFFS